MAKQWSYATAPWCKVGLMKCTKCGKKIESGLYRYRETEDAYLPQHRACCEEDPKWKYLDEEAERETSARAEKLAACIAFRQQWGVDELDELIAHLRKPT